MPEQITFETRKRPFEKFSIPVNFSSQMNESEKLVTAGSSLAATKENDGSDVSDTFLDSTTPTIPGGTATGGSTTTIVNTGIDHAANGFKVGDFVVNTTKGYVAQIKKIKTVTNVNDTLEFAEQEVAAAVSDDYTAQKAVAVVQAGTAGDRVRVSYKIATDQGNQLQADVIVHVVS